MIGGPLLRCTEAAMYYEQELGTQVGADLRIWYNTQVSKQTPVVIGGPEPQLVPEPCRPGQFIDRDGHCQWPQNSDNSKCQHGQTAGEHGNCEWPQNSGNSKCQHGQTAGEHGNCEWPQNSGNSKCQHGQTAGEHGNCEWPQNSGNPSVSIDKLQVNTADVRRLRTR